MIRHLWVSTWLIVVWVALWGEISVGNVVGGVLVAAGVQALATAMDAWLAAVIVGAGLLAVAGVVALLGKRQIEEATPPAPERAMKSVKRDVETVKTRARR